MGLVSSRGVLGRGRCCNQAPRELTSFSPSVLAVSSPVSCGVAEEVRNVAEDRQRGMEGAPPSDTPRPPEGTEGSGEPGASLRSFGQNIPALGCWLLVEI